MGKGALHGAYDPFIHFITTGTYTGPQDPDYIFGLTTEFSLHPLNGFGAYSLGRAGPTRVYGRAHVFPMIMEQNRETIRGLY
jgi:hypothetical protein